MTRVSAPVAGFVLIDSLLALLVLALALLGLGQTIARQLAETRSTQARAVALQFIDAAAEHLAVIPASPSAPFEVAESELPPRWNGLLKAALPGAAASVFRTLSVPRQVRIAIAWPANERQMTTADAELQQEALGTTLAKDGYQCPPTFLCHVAYVSQ